MSKIIITGGAGFVGSHLAEYLQKKGHEIVILDDLSGGFERNIPNGTTFIKCDITNKEDINSIFEQEKPDYVYHLAAYAAEGLSSFIRNYNYMDNLIGSINIINACVNNNIKKLIFTSSMGVYGSLPTPYTEEQIPVPEDPYGIAKYAVEKDLKCAKEFFGLEYVIFRPHNIVGTKQNIGDSYRNVFGIWVNQLLKGQEITIFGDGTQVRAFSYIQDMLPYFEQAMYNDKAIGNIYNIGGEIPYTINQAAEIILKEFPDGKKIHLDPRVEVHTAYSDHSKLYRDFGKLSELTSIDFWLKEYIDYAKELGPQETTKFKGIEIEKNIPKKWKDLIF